MDSDSMVMVCSMLPTIRAWSKRRAIGPPKMLANGPLVAYSSFSVFSFLDVSICIVRVSLTDDKWQDGIKYYCIPKTLE